MKKKVSYLTVGVIFLLVGAGLGAMWNTSRFLGGRKAANHTTPPRAELAAKMAGEEITVEQLAGDDRLELYLLEKRVYDFKMARLGQLRRDRALASGAKGSGLSVEDFIRKKILRGQAAVSRAEIEAFASEKRLPANVVSDPKSRERIASYLEALKREKAVEAYGKSAYRDQATDIYFPKPSFSLRVEAPIDAPSLGSTSAEVQVIEFSDILCEACRKAEAAVEALHKKYGRQVRWVFRYFPSSGEPSVEGPVEAALCAHQQGRSFWDFRKLMLEKPHTGRLDRSELESVAQRAKVDVQKWRACLDNRNFEPYLRRDLEAARRIGLRSSPVYFVNNQPVMSVTELSAAIEAELE